MIDTEFYTKNERDKLGNALIFLCEKLSPITQVSKTHILKLIFILEELSVKRFGVPMFNLKFSVWKLGPVSKDLFAELSDEPTLLAGYITRVPGQNGNWAICPARKFSDDEFSDRELDLMEHVTDRFKFCTAGELINFTHRKDSPWYQTAQRHGIIEALESGKLNTTDIEIDLSELIEEDEEKLSLYHTFKEFVTQSKLLKN